MGNNEPSRRKLRRGEPETASFGVVLRARLQDPRRRLTVSPFSSPVINQDHGLVPDRRQHMNTFSDYNVVWIDVSYVLLLETNREKGHALRKPRGDCVRPDSLLSLGSRT